MTPTQRSIRELESDGYTVEKVERFNPFAKRRVDLLGFADILAIRPSEIVAVQTTTGDHSADRINKIVANPKALTWLRAGGMIFVHGWRKVGTRGKRKLWQCKTYRVTMEDFMEV